MITLLCTENNEEFTFTGTHIHPIWFSSVQFSRSIVSDSLRPHELQHARPPCPSPTPGVHSGSRPSSLWCHPAISSSVILFSSCPQSLPASESFPMSQLFAWGGWSIGVSALALVLPKIFFRMVFFRMIFFRMDWLDLLAFQGTLKSLLQHHSSKASILQHSAFFTIQLSHLYMTTGKTIALTRRTFAGKVISLHLECLLQKDLLSLETSLPPGCIRVWCGLQIPAQNCILRMTMGKRGVFIDTWGTVSGIAVSDRIELLLTDFKLLYFIIPHIL